MAHNLSRKAAIVGIGATEFSKDSGRTEMQLACEAVKAALDDAGIKGADIDGMATFSMDHNWENEILRQVGGKELKFSRAPNLAAALPAARSSMRPWPLPRACATPW